MSGLPTPPNASQDLTGAKALLMAGDAAGALALMRALVAAEPSKHELRYWLASAALGAGQADEADGALNDARLLHAFALIRGFGGDVQRLTKDPAYAVAVADMLYDANAIATAGVALSLAISAGHPDLQALFTYGLCLHHQGRAEEAALVFRAVTESDRTTAQAHEFLLFSLFFVKDGVRRHAAEAREWARLYEDKGPAPPLKNSREPGRKLRIGYVAPSFVRQQARQFIIPLIESHDREQVEVFLYPTDAAGETDWAQPVTVRAIGALSDQDAAALIRKDRIDVLVDVWGHNPGNRLPVFGRRVAPVQVTWLNYQQTTGLTNMDYALHADSVPTPGMAELFTETVWTVPRISAPFRPDPQVRISPAPSLASGQVTFGSFTNPAKVSDETVAAWARILKGRPRSRLLLKYRYYEDHILARVTAARFAAHGVDADRLVFDGHSKGEAYENAFGLVDLALDTSPCPGGTTSLEALSRGVPVLALRGETFYSRAGLAIVKEAGLPDLVTDSWDDYVAKAIEISASPASLQALRDRAVAGFAVAAYRDEAGVARMMEKAYREMFELWRVKA